MTTEKQDIGARYRVRGLLLMLLGVLLLSSCAPARKITRGEAAQGLEFARAQIREAGNAEAGRYAPDEFKKANESLSAAREAFKKNDYKTSAKLSDKAVSYADKARVKVAQKRKKS